MTGFNGERESGINVKVTIDSVGDNGSMKQQVAGHLFPKGRQCYLRYAEPPEAQMGQTTTTVRIELGKLRVLRRGDIELEQTFVPEQVQRGYIDVPQGRMELETHTEAVSISGDWNAAGAIALTVRWSYQLLLMGESAGSFAISLLVEQADERGRDDEA